MIRCTASRCVHIFIEYVTMKLMGRNVVCVFLSAHRGSIYFTKNRRRVLLPAGTSWSATSGSAADGTTRQLACMTSKLYFFTDRPHHLNQVSSQDRSASLRPRLCMHSAQQQSCRTDHDNRAYKLGKGIGRHTAEISRCSWTGMRLSVFHSQQVGLSFLGNVRPVAVAGRFEAFPPQSLCDMLPPPRTRHHHVGSCALSF